MFADFDEVDVFYKTFCHNCTKSLFHAFKIEKNCQIEKAIPTAMIQQDTTIFPYDDLIPCDLTCRYICKNFAGKTPEMQRKYEQLRREVEVVNDMEAAR